MLKENKRKRSFIKESKGEVKGNGYRDEGDFNLARF